MIKQVAVKKWCHTTTWLSWDCSAFWLADSLSFFLNSNMARTKVTPRKGERGELRWVRTRAEVHAQPQKPSTPVDPQLQCKECHWIRRRWGGGWWRQSSWRRWEGHQGHLQPNIWPRWLWRPGYLHWVGRSQLARSSDLPWETMSPGRNSCGLHHWRSPKSTNWGQWLFARSTGSKRAQSSLFGNCPSHG